MTAVTAGPIAGEQVDAREYFEDYPLEAIIESPLNPRQHYDAKALQELADSLKANSQLTPALVRPIEDVKPVRVDGLNWLPVELAAGHRRFRALKLAGIRTMRLVRQPMTDAEFVEALQIENLQRDNLHPLEEARGFRSLMDVVGYDLDRIAARIGRTRSYVYDRLKLLQLTPHAQELFLAGRFELGHAIILARLAPSEQDRAIGDPEIGYEGGGLFTTDRSTMREMGGGAAIQEDLETDLDGLKPVSTRELQGWINEMVRFRPEDVDTPNLFPETAAALAAAEEERRKVVPITYSRALTGPAKDPARRTYLRDSWKRADGQPDVDELGREMASPVCDHAILGMVVAGQARGESFNICVAKRKCEIHWAREIAAAAKAADQEKSGAKPAKTRPSWEVEEERRREEAKRWERARPAILDAVAKAVMHLGLPVLARTALQGFRGVKVPPALAGTAGSAIDVVRQAAYLNVAEVLSSVYGAERWVQTLKPLGIDPKKIRDQVAPLKKAEQPKAPAKSTSVQKKATLKAKPKKKLAGDVRRAKAKKKGAAK